MERLTSFEVMALTMNIGAYDLGLMTPNEFIKIVDKICTAHYLKGKAEGVRESTAHIREALGVDQ